MKMLFTLVLTVLAVLPAFAVERPNILWVFAEDLSPYMGCYIRNYYLDRPMLQPQYRDKSATVMAFRKLHEEGRLTKY